MNREDTSMIELTLIGLVLAVLIAVVQFGNPF